MALETLYYLCILFTSVNVCGGTCIWQPRQELFLTAATARPFFALNRWVYFSKSPLSIFAPFSFLSFIRALNSSSVFLKSSLILASSAENLFSSSFAACSFVLSSFLIFSIFSSRTSRSSSILPFAFALPLSLKGWPDIPYLSLSRMSLISASQPLYLRPQQPSLYRASPLINRHE